MVVVVVEKRLARKLQNKKKESETVRTHKAKQNGKGKALLLLLLLLVLLMVQSVRVCACVLCCVLEGAVTSYVEAAESRREKGPHCSSAEKEGTERSRYFATPEVWVMRLSTAA